MQQEVLLERKPVRARTDLASRYPVPGGPRRNRSWGRFALLAAGALTLFLASAGVGLSSFMSGFGQAGPTPVKAVAEPRPGERMNILVLGVDSGKDKVQRSDTMMVLSLDPAAREIGLLSIPRDTLVSIPGESRRDKITHAHAFGGPEKAMAAASDFIGEPLHSYVKVDFQGFKSLVDILGGVTVDVEKRMRYRDPTQNLNIDLQPGRQRLNGDKALQFVRYRQDGDLFRIRRQQEFLQAVGDESLRLGTVFKLPRLLREGTRYVKTNLGADDMVRLAQLAASVKREDIHMATVPTSPHHNRRGEYLGEDADPQATLDLVDRLVRGVDRDANAQVAVRVLDGSGQGLGPAVSSILEGEGYRVVGVAQAPRQDYANTTVLYANADMNHQGQVLARNLSREIATVRLYRARDPASDLGAGEGMTAADVVVVAGRDAQVRGGM